MGPSRSLGPVLSRPVLGPSRDFPGRDSPAGKPSTYVVKCQKNANLICEWLNKQARFEIYYKKIGGKMEPEVHKIKKSNHRVVFS